MPSFPPFPVFAYFKFVLPIWYFCSRWFSLNVWISTLPSPVCCLWPSWGTQHTSQEIPHSWRQSRHSLVIHFISAYTHVSTFLLPESCQSFLHLQGKVHTYFTMQPLIIFSAISPGYHQEHVHPVKLSMLAPPTGNFNHPLVGCILLKDVSLPCHHPTLSFPKLLFPQYFAPFPPTVGVFRLAVTLPWRTTNF